MLDLLAMTVNYHADPNTLQIDIGDVVPIGEPWLTSSACTSFLVSLPYPLGPDLELVEWPEGHARLLWLLPITDGEAVHRRLNGLESLEEAFDAAAIDFADPRRPSVIEQPTARRATRIKDGLRRRKSRR